MEHIYRKSGKVRERIDKWTEDSGMLGEIQGVSEEGGVQKITYLC